MEASRRFFIAALVLIQFACASSSKTRPSAAELPVGVAAPEATAANELPRADDYGPTPARPRSVVLVLGPGLARGFAHVGVIRALSEAKIQIGAVVGTEMGGLIAALYALGGTASEMDWRLLRIKDETLYERPLFAGIFGRISDGKKLEQALDRVFLGKDLRESRVPALLLMSVGGRTVSASAGRASIVSLAAFSDPTLFRPVEMAGASALSAGEARPYGIKEALALELGPVVVVDVLHDASLPNKHAALEDEISYLNRLLPAESRAADELKDANLVLRPRLLGVGVLDFKKRTDIIYRGREAALSAMNEIRQIVEGAQ